MKRKSVALLLATVMTVSTVGSVPYVSAAELQDVEIAEIADDAEQISVEEPTEDGAVVLEASPEAAAEISADAAEDFVIVDETAGVPVEAAADEAAGEEIQVEMVEEVANPLLEAEAPQPQKPGKVVNVAFDQEDPDHMSWNADVAADGYQIEVTDGKYTYRDWYENYLEANNNGIYLTTSDLYAYTAEADGTLNQYYDEKGSSVTAFQAGSTYTLRVRAYNELTDESGDSATEYGDWSDPVTYTRQAATVPDRPSNLEIDEEDGYLYWHMDKSADRYQIAVTDAEGRAYYEGCDVNEAGQLQPVYDDSWWNGYYLGYDLYTYQLSPNGTAERVTVPDPADPTKQVDVKAFETGKTYYIAVRSVNRVGNWDSSYNKETDDLYSAWTDPVAYTKTEKVIAVPGKVGGLKYEDGELSWRALKDIYQYEIEVADSQGRLYYTGYSEDEETGVKTGNYWNIYGNYASIDEYLITYDASWTAVPDVKAFTPGENYTVRVRAYNFYKGKKQVGEWSDGVTVVCPKKTIGKVAGLWLDPEEGTLSWNKVENADYYEIAVKDAAGRSYYSGMNEDGTGSNLTYYGTSVDLDDGLYTYVMVDGKPVPAIHDNGDRIRAFEKGQTYTITVNAVMDTEKGESSDAVTYTVPMDPVGINEKPAAVTGVTVKTRADADEATLYGAELHWNYVPKAQKYEIRVTDAAGHEFVLGAKMKDDAVKMTYYSPNTDAYSNKYPYISLSDLSGLKAYVKEAGTALAVVKDPATGKELEAITAGQTYSLQVRAVNTYKEWDAAKGDWKEEVELAGDWSAPVTYTAGSIAPITDLTYVSQDEDYYYFTYSASLANSRVWYQIATDPSFGSAALLNYHWTSFGSSEDKLAIYKDYWDLEAGKTYYVRAINSMKAPTDQEVAVLNPAPASFVAEAAKAPKNITGLYVYKTYSESVSFRFDAVLDDNDEYELQYTDKAAPAEADWRSLGQTTSLYTDDLKEGVVYVRAVGYVWGKDAAGKRVKTYGVPSNVVAVTISRATSSISDLKLAEKTQSAFVFKWTGNIRKDEEIEFCYSESSAFTSDRTVTKYSAYDNDWEEDTELTDGTFTIPYTSLIPGKTYYVRARVYNRRAKTDAEKYGAYTNVVKFTAKMPNVSVSATTTAKTITLKMSASSDDKYLTGYQIQKKDGKSYKTLGKTTDSVYTVSGLKSDTVYTLRVRPYYYNSETQKTAYGSWVYYETTTWGAALKVTAKAAGKTSVKLSWNKISGAQGYEVYRMTGYSKATEISDNMSNDYTKYTLVKSVNQPKKGSTVSFTDKKLTANLDYSYMVRAYRTVGEKKYYIYGSDYVNLGFSGFGHGYTTINYTNGKVGVFWNPVYSAKGYLVEKYDENTEKWTEVKKLKNSTSSYKLPKTTDNNGVRYRIRAYASGSVYSDPINVTVYPFVAAPTSVKAAANSNAGYIKITWKPVSGADYYRVYRTTSSEKVYNKNTQSYEYMYPGEEVPVYVADASKVSGYRELTDPKDLTQTTVYDREITYTANGVTNTLYAGPSRDVKYYYYVVAYKNGKAYNYAEENYDGGTKVSGASKAASATLKSSIKVSTPTLKSAKTGTNKVTLTWKAVSGAKGYEVFRSEKKSSGFVKIAAITNGKTVTYVDKNSVKSDKTYYYKVRAYKYTEAGVEKYSSFSKVKTAKAAVTVAKPTLKSAAAGKQSATLTWKAVKGAKGYVIYRSTKKSSGYKKVATIKKGSTVKYVNKKLKSGSTYYYKICAYKKDKAGKNVYSAYSAVKKVTAK